MVLLLLVLALCCEMSPVNGRTGTGESIVAIDGLSSARAAHAATPLADGRLLITGGMLENGQFHDSAEIYDPKQKRFEVLRSRMTTKRVSHIAASLPSGKVLLAGGWSNRDAPTESAELFDPKNLTFTSTGSLKDGRSGHTATVADDGRIIVIGGRSGSAILSSIEAYDPKQERFSKIGELKVPRGLHTATLLRDGRILVTGGMRDFGRVTSSAELFDPIKGESVLLETGLSSERYKHDALRLANGRVLVLGGSDARDRRGRSNEAEVFDPKKGVFEKVGSLTFARFKIQGTSVLLKDGRVLVAGGAARAEVFDPKSGQFTVVAGDLGDRFHFATSTLLESGETLIVGGYRFLPTSGPSGTDQAWIFDG